MVRSDDESIKILIVDDHTIVRAGLRMLIESQPGMAVVGEASSVEDALTFAARERPDIILLDLDLGGDSGLSVMPDLAQSSAASRVIILTGVRDPQVHRKAIRLGAMGLVLKDKAADVLIKAIEKVHAGEVWLDRTMTASVLAEISRAGPANRQDPEGAKIASLTERECEIIKLVCEGLKNKQIAARLFISESTVRNHLTSILAKLGLSDRFELALYSYRNGLASPPC